MTDNELKVLVASLVEAQKKTDEQIKVTGEQLKVTDEQLRASIASVVESQKETEIQVAKTSAKVDKVASMYGGMANNQGAATEEFYYNSLKRNPVLHGIRFDAVYKNIVGIYQGIEDEYDIIMVNGKAVYIICLLYTSPSPRDS